jgi:hypothetical protein
MKSAKAIVSGTEKENLNHQLLNPNQTKAQVAFKAAKERLKLADSVSSLSKIKSELGSPNSCQESIIETTESIIGNDP